METIKCHKCEKEWRRGEEGYIDALRNIIDTEGPSGEPGQCGTCHAGPDCPYCGSTGLDPDTMETCPDCGKGPEDDFEDAGGDGHDTSRFDSVEDTPDPDKWRGTTPIDDNRTEETVRENHTAEIDHIVEELLGEIALGIQTTKEVITSLIEKLSEEAIKALGIDEDDRQMRLPERE